LGDLGVDIKIILKWILRIWVGRASTGLAWISIRLVTAAMNVLVL
jgi:hypothetical protein